LQLLVNALLTLYAFLKGFSLTSLPYTGVSRLTSNSPTDRPYVQDRNLIWSRRQTRRHDQYRSYQKKMAAHCSDPLQVNY